jgi:hypothetical protein
MKHFLFILTAVILTACTSRAERLNKMETSDNYTYHYVFESLASGQLTKYEYVKDQEVFNFTHFKVNDTLVLLTTIDEQMSHQEIYGYYQASKHWLGDKYNYFISDSVNGAYINYDVVILKKHMFTEK